MIEQPLPNTIEFQEIIPGIKPPRVPILIPGMEKLPLMPGWIIRDPEGNVINAGIRIPILTWETSKPPEEQPEYPVMPVLPDIPTLRDIPVASLGALEEEEMEL
jgi:hypothetical protein